MKKSYSDKLKDPRWQKKRLKKLEAQDWACCWCNATNKTLTVHHGYYSRNIEPWDYPDGTLWTLCDSCHERAEREREYLYYCLATFHPKQLSMLVDGFEGSAHFLQIIIGAFAVILKDGVSNHYFPKAPTLDAAFVWFRDLAVLGLVQYDGTKNTPPDDPEETDLLKFYSGFLVAIGKISAFVRSYLADAQPVTLKAGVLEILLEDDQEMAFEALTTPKSQACMEVAMSQIGYPDFRVEIIKGKAERKTDAA